MYTLKEKVTEKFSHLFADSASSTSPRLEKHQAQSYSKGGRSLSSIFSFVLPSASIDKFKPHKHQGDIKQVQSLPGRWYGKDFDWQGEPFDRFAESDLACGNGEALDTHEEYEDPPSGRSTSDSDVFEEAIDLHSPQKPVPSLSENSSFISSDLYEFFKSCLPNIVKDCQWLLLYSTLKHGISLRTLIRKSAEVSGPCLLIVGDMQGAVFGGMLECPLQPTAKRKYQGTNQTFVFTTIYGEPRLFRPTGANRYFYLCLNDLLALGGGGSFALSLDEDLLSGTSGPCDTFGNLCLAHSPEFELKNVELWGFTHSSQYLT